ncbi:MULTISPECIES: hypothetical protein [unclassified Actinobaculum]|uniref:hypothetical protein n=1 Tax=unclassified Actinobaculum TaxID=2609299 RepID=UPI0013DD9B05|nr:MULTISPECIES: hypothetical protein [unclassified Actinobaculum]
MTHTASDASASTVPTGGKALVVSSDEFLNESRGLAVEADDAGQGGLPQPGYHPRDS